MIPSTLKTFIFSYTFFALCVYSGLQVVLGPGDSLGEDKGSGSCSCITRFHSYSPLCAASFTGERAVRAGILFHRESEVLGTESLLPIAPHLILGGSIISMAGGLEWRDGIRVDTEAYALLQFSSNLWR